MKATKRPLASNWSRGFISLVLTAFFGVGVAATTEYFYDALGRLRKVSHDNGVQTDYTLDAAGNRTKVDDLGTAAPSAPGSLTVGSTSAGSFAPYWGSAVGAFTRYELYESLSSSFSPQTLVYSGLSLSATLTGRLDGTYYYRVRACNAASCGGYIAAANPMVVTVPPPAPNPPTIPTRTLVQNCVWRATWTAPTGGGAFTHYVVRDTVGAEQAVSSTQANVVCPTNNQNANKPKWVKACSATACSSQAVFP